MNEVEVPILEREICNLWLEHKELNVTDGMICAGYPDGGKDACQVRINHALTQIQIYLTRSEIDYFKNTFMIEIGSYKKASKNIL